MANDLLRSAPMKRVDRTDLKKTIPPRGGIVGDYRRFLAFAFFAFFFFAMVFSDHLLGSAKLDPHSHIYIAKSVLLIKASH